MRDAAFFVINNYFLPWVLCDFSLKFEKYIFKKTNKGCVYLNCSVLISVSISQS